MSMRKLGLLAVVVGLCCGCAESDGDRVSIAGEVTLDGAPLETGVISFQPVDGQGNTAGATITNGKYETKIEPGIKKVSIVSQKKVGQEPRDPADPNGPQIEHFEDLVPAKYNQNTTLQVDVPADGKPDANFPLTSK